MELSLPDMPFGMGGRRACAATHAGKPSPERVFKADAIAAEIIKRCALARSLSPSWPMSWELRRAARENSGGRRHALARLGRQKAPRVVIEATAKPSDRSSCGRVGFCNAA